MHVDSALQESFAQTGSDEVLSACSSHGTACSTVGKEKDIESAIEIMEDEVNEKNTS